MKEACILLENEHGIHTRAAAQIVDCAAQFSSKITLQFNALEVDAKRIMQVLTLGAKRGDAVSICVEGSDEVDALSALSSLIEKALI